MQTDICTLLMFQVSQPSQTKPYIDVSNTAQYVGHMEDHNKPLVCISSQFDKSGAVIYTSQVDLSLEVLAVERGLVLAIPVGGIIGIILAILIIFLLCILLACCLLKRRKKQYHDGGFVEQEVITATDTKHDSTTIEHAVHVTGAEDYHKNYDVNISQIHYKNEDIHCNESDKLLLENNEKLSKISDNLETLLILGKKGRKDSSSSSSSSSSRSGGSSASAKIKKKLKKAKQSNEVDLGSLENTNTVTNIYKSNISTSKHDSTFIYNGKRYKEEVFEHHIEENKPKVVPFPAKIRGNKWKNNLSDIKEDEDFYSSHLYEGKSKSEYGQKSDEYEHLLRKTVNAETSANYIANQTIIHQIAEESSRQEKEKRNKAKKANSQNETTRDKLTETNITKTDQTCTNQVNWSSVEESVLVQAASPKKSVHIPEEKKATNTTFIPAYKIKSKTLNDRLDMSVDKKFLEIGTIPTPIPVKTDNKSSHMTQQESFQQTIHIESSDDSSDKKSRSYQDEHYYIGDSEYAAVVEEHVKGKYENDLEYFQEKSNEVITVHPKVWTIEEIYRQENRCVQETSTKYSEREPREAEMLPASPPLHTKEEYIANWISLERLDMSPNSDKSYPEINKRNFSYENDRSDESCIVDVEMAKQESVHHSQTKGSIYQHITDQVRSVAETKTRNKHFEDYLGMAQKKETPTEKDVVSGLFHKVGQKHVTNSHKSSMKPGWNIKQDKKEMVEDKPGQITANTTLSAGQHGGKRKRYKITQQEIVFYLKNKDGLVKVVRRPLLHSANSTLSTDETNNSFIRHKSQPNLYSAHILRHVDETADHQYEQQAGKQGGGTPKRGASHHLHIPSAGLLQHAQSWKQVKHIIFCYYKYLKLKKVFFIDYL